MLSDQTAGGLVVLLNGSRFVYYLVVRQKYWDSTRTDSFEQSVLKLSLHCEDKKVRHLAVNIPPGAGISWPTALETFNNIFDGLNVRLYMYKMSK